MDAEVREAYSFFLTEKGKVLLRHWGKKFGFTNRTTLVSNDPLTTAFHEGQRVVFQTILLEVERAMSGEDKPKEVAHD